MNSSEACHAYVVSINDDYIHGNNDHLLRLFLHTSSSGRAHWKSLSCPHPSFKRVRDTLHRVMCRRSASAVYTIAPWMVSSGALVILISRMLEGMGYSLSIEKSRSEYRLKVGIPDEELLTHRDSTIRKCALEQINPGMRNEANEQV